MLENALIVENSDVSDHKRVKSEIIAFGYDIKDVYYLAPTKVLIVFQSKLDADIAVADESALWNLFDDVRVWQRGRCLMIGLCAWNALVYTPSAGLWRM